MIEVVLKPGAAISGIVTRADGQVSVGAGVVVFALPTREYFLNPMDIALAGIKSEAVPQASTDEMGRFELASLEPGLKYTLIASGNGLYSGLDHQGILAGTTDTVIHVTPLFAIHVTFETPFGPLLAASAWAGRSEGTKFISSRVQAGVEFILVDDCMARLAGTRLTDSIEDTCLIVLQSKTPVDRVGPLTLITRFPGYKPAEFDVYGRVLDEDFVGDTFMLEPVSETLGSVQLNSIHSPDSFARADPELLAGVLSFQDTRGDNFRIAVTFGDLGACRE